MSVRSAGELLETLSGIIMPRRRMLTAYSGGVDSTLVAAVARRVLGKANAPAALGDSASLPRPELHEARRIATSLDIEIIEVQPGEQGDADYRANRGDRCFFCKTHLYATLQTVARERSIAWIANGTNTDDLGDHRPGLTAADNAGVISPLLDAKMNKADVRTLAEHLSLPNWDKPAAPCLASRIAYGTPVTLERLSKVEQAEGVLRDLGFHGFRVRHHEEIARIEVPGDQLSRIMDEPTRREVNGRLRAIGYTYVTLDLDGFRSGSGNDLLVPGVEKRAAAT